jgi:hypothetical protein
MSSFSFSRNFLLFLLLTLNAFTARAQWAKVAGLPNDFFAVVKSYGDTLFAAGPGRIYRSLDGGIQWDSSAILSPGQDFITDLVQVQGTLYVGTGLDGMFVSYDQGASWETLNEGLSGLGAFSITMLAVRGDQLYAGTGGARVFARTVGIAGPWSSFGAGMYHNNVESLVNLDGLLLAGGSGNATLYRNEAGSAFWEEMPFDQFNGLLSIFLGAIAGDNRIVGAGTKGLYTSDDQGLTWDPHDPGIGLIGLARFARNGDTIWAGLQKASNQSFLFSTTDEGATWEAGAWPPSNPPLYDLAFFQNRLYAATGNGVWRYDLTSGSPALPGPPDWGPVWPNPATHQASMAVTLARAGAVHARLLDMAGGRPAREWRFGTFPAGSHRLDLDLRDLPAGAYVLEITAGNRRESRRLAIIP